MAKCKALTGSAVKGLNRTIINYQTNRLVSGITSYISTWCVSARVYSSFHVTFSVWPLSPVFWSEASSNDTIRLLVIVAHFRCLRFRVCPLPLSRTVVQLVLVFYVRGLLSVLRCSLHFFGCKPTYCSLSIFLSPIVMAHCRIFELWMYLLMKYGDSMNMIY